MANNVKLKDLYNNTQTYSGVDVVYLLDADSEQDVKVYTERTVRQYALYNTPTFEPIPTEALFTFVYDGIGDRIEYPAGSGHYVGDDDGSNITGFIVPPNTNVGNAHSVIEVIIGNPENTLFYVYENTTNQQLHSLFLISIDTTTTFVLSPGWNKAVFDENKKITSFEHLDDVSNIVFDISFPTSIFATDMVNAVMYEASQETKSVTVTQNGASSIVPSKGKSGIAQLNLEVNVPQQELQEKSVTITQNGTTEVVPDAGYDGMSKLTAVVNVEGGGGGVQANWAQNDSAAPDYVQNRPGAYYATIPAKTYTFDGDLTGKTYEDTQEVVLVSSDIITKDALSASTYTRVVNGEATAPAVASVTYAGGAFLVGDMSTGELYVAVIPTDEASATLGIAKGIWFGCNADATTYTSALTTPASSAPVELPQELTEVKQADWGASSGIRSIQNRIGGYYNKNTDDITITFDGSFEGKTTTKMDDTRTLVKVLNYPLTMMQLASAKNITIYMNDTDVSVGNSIVLPRWSSNDELDAFKWMMANIVNVQSGTTTAVGQLTSVYAEFVHPVGTYLVVNTNSDGSIKQPYIKSIDVETPSCDMLYGWYIYPDFNGKPISGDTLILPSSTPNSAKKFKIKVDDNGAITATEVTN